MALNPQDQQISNELIMRLAKERGLNMGGNMVPTPAPTMADLMSDPEAMDAGADAASALSPRNSLTLMGMGAASPTPGGGGMIARKSPFESMADGVKTGMGFYNLLNTQQAKANALRAMGKKDPLNPMVQVPGAAPADEGYTPADAFPVNMN